MGRILLIRRLAARDIRRHRAQAVLMVVAILATSATLTLGLILHGVTSHPYQQTRAATAGPDVVANVISPSSKPPSPVTLARLAALTRAPGVAGHSGPFPVTWAVLRTHGRTAGAEAEGRAQTAASVDQPALTQGSWVRAGGVVIERSFADALGVSAGDSITLNGRPFRVGGVAVSAAMPPYSQVCFEGCALNTPVLAATDPGLIWLTTADARSLATRAEPLAYFLNLKLADPSRAGSFALGYDNKYDANPDSAGPYLASWQDLSQQDALLVRNEQLILQVGSWLLTLLAVASVAVLVGGRMADQIRRVGLLKAVGGTPGLVAAVLLAEYLVLALVAAVAGLAVGWLAAPLLTNPGAGLLGTAGAPPLTLSTAEVVVAVALAVAVAATFVPAIRAARTSTVGALADSARSPRRRAVAVAVSARLPVPLLLGLRVAARRPRRMVLSAASVAITVSGIVAVLIAHAQNAQQLGAVSGPASPRTDRINQILLVIMIMLIALAAINAIFITWTTALDARQSSALARALGATPEQVSAGLSAAQLLPALAGAVLGIPGGIGLVLAVSHSGSPTTLPPAWQLIAVVPGTLLAVAALTAIPARIGGRRPRAEILQSELA
jgi:ABC-type antimicrobial peptide transport system permease subunit